MLVWRSRVRQKPHQVCRESVAIASVAEHDSPELFGSDIRSSHTSPLPICYNHKKPHCDRREYKKTNHSDDNKPSGRRCRFRILDGQ